MQMGCCCGPCGVALIGFWRLDELQSGKLPLYIEATAIIVMVGVRNKLLNSFCTVRCLKR